MTLPTCWLCDEDHEWQIGRSGKPLHVFALRGGGALDTMFQLGVAHAYLVSGATPPGLIVGASSGAINAAAIAEILKADDKLTPTDAKQVATRREARMNRFREVLYAYQDFANNLPAAVPDAYEADAGRALQPNPQAIHFDKEREARQDALRARSGIIQLINDLLGQTLTVAMIARATRVFLGWRAAAALPRWQRASMRLQEVWRAAGIINRDTIPLLRLTQVLMKAYVGGTARLLRSELREWRPTLLRRWARTILRFFEGRHAEGSTAGAIIFSSKYASAQPMGVMVLITMSVIAIALVMRFLSHWSPSLLLHLAIAALTYALYLAVDAMVGHPSLLADARKLLTTVLRTTPLEHVFAYYDLQQDLGNDYLIQELLIRLFDPSYHGTIDAADVAARAVAPAPRPHEPPSTHQARRFTSFSQGRRPIVVVPLVADLRRGKIATIPDTFRVVDGLRAAVSVVPFLRPKPSTDDDAPSTTYYVDAVNVANQPALAALDILRNRLRPDVPEVIMYLVSSLTARETSSRTPTGAVGVGLASVTLSRLRDATMEEELINAYNESLSPHTMPPERPPHDVARALRCFGNREHFVRTTLVPITPPAALHVTERFLAAPTTTAREQVLAEAVAAGCQATLRAIAQQELTPATGGCRPALMQAVQQTLQTAGMPGATEICATCALRPNPATPPTTASGPSNAAPGVQTAVPPAQEPVDAATSVRDALSPVLDLQPKISLLFSGGVFRGVFQIGVLNAASELGIRPNIIAGSSVGSIVAAMIASVFTTPSRKPAVARLAATFLILDRLVITDRFADFVRRFTLRAASAKFSLRDADKVFRTYDTSGPLAPVARRVLAGIEHLLYISPFELAALLQAVRTRRYAEAYHLLGRYAQGLCDRGLVGLELLGAEPLSLLIKQHVLPAHLRDLHAHAVTIEHLENGILKFLITATNLTRRAGTIIDGTRRAALVEALLASSAFPAVFRPRWAREVYFNDNSVDQYIDGGVLDNLPISAVVQYLRAQAKDHHITYRPPGGVPHLLLTASLEPGTPTLTRPAAEHAARFWPRARRRAKRLRYNQKIDTFANVQADVRAIAAHYARQPIPTAQGQEILDLDLVAIKPAWLCDTFAFHPMLGFRTENQAASIAHGCAATFHTIAQIVKGADPARASWPAAWGMRTDDLELDAGTRMPPKDKRDGTCHFRTTAACPFSMQELARISAADVRPEVRTQLHAIYTLCGQAATHQRAPSALFREER